MKAIALLNRTVLATLLVSASLSAFAGGGGPRGSGPYPYSGTAAMAAASAHADAAPSSDLLLAAVDRPSVPAWTASADPVAAATSEGKTRAQVRAELIQAERDGLIPAGNIHYPPGPQTIARNKLDFQEAKDWWQAHGLKSEWGG